MLIGYRLLLICEGAMFLNIQVWEPYLFTFCKRCLVENLQETACGGSVSSTDGGVSQDAPLFLCTRLPVPVSMKSRLNKMPLRIKSPLKKFILFIKTPLKKLHIQI